MWVLVIVLLTPVSGFQTSYRLDNSRVYTQVYECYIDRNRVAKDMAEAYPNELETFRIECREVVISRENPA